MRTVAFDSAKLSPPSDEPKEELTQQQQRQRWRKYGRLCVLHLHKKQQRRRQRVDCICECGRIVTLDWLRVRDGEIKNCRNKNCMWSRLDKQADTEKRELSTPAIVDRLKPKWYCSRPEEGCMWSSLCHICCCECDKKHCDLRCANNPAQCGGAERRKK